MRWLGCGRLDQGGSSGYPLAAHRHAQPRQPFGHGEHMGVFAEQDGAVGHGEHRGLDPAG